MKVIFPVFLFISSLLSQEIDNSFITKFEYGAMLYKNPRGIGCHKCHGIGNKTVLIAKYLDKKGISQSLKAPPINKVSFSVFKKKLQSSKYESRVMPTYFLTNEEINSIYYYVTNVK